jgi:two-component system, OmpR family, sensor kinase
VLLLSLVLTALVALGFERAVRAREQARFRNAVQSTEDRIQARIDTYVVLLLGLRGFFVASYRVEPEEFRRYVEQLEVQLHYPGIQGLGFSLRMSAEARPGVEAEMRRQGLSSFKVWPEGPRREYHAILYLEPLDLRNRAALGFDMSSEPVRRAAMERARDSGAPTASGLVTLVQEITAQKQAGFLIYVPVYRGERAPQSVAARRVALMGYVYSPFRADDLFEGLFGHVDPWVSFEVYDGPKIHPAALLYRSPPGRPPHAARLEASERLQLAGRVWTLRVLSTPAFEASLGRQLLPGSIAIGLLASLALFFVSRAQVLARQRVEAMAEELGRAVQLRDDFLSVAGHELKTPLAALTLQLQNLRRRAAQGEPAPAPLLERLDKISGQVARLSRLVNELLDVSRITSDRLALQLEEVELGALAREVVERFSDQLERAGCSLLLQVEAPVVGRWDRGRLDQVITNLLSNAIKYSPGKPIELSVAQGGTGVRLTVRDQGIGIPSKVQGRIFERFERAVSERHYGGLGLGLWISRQIVLAHGGTISLQSAPGEGSTFTVELPLKVPAGETRADS